MTVKTDDAARRRTAPRTSGGGAARAGTGEQLSRADRVAQGKDARAMALLESHAEFTLDASRDPVGLLLEQEKSRQSGWRSGERGRGRRLIGMLGICGQ